MLIGIDANEANLTSRRVGINQYAFNLIHALYNLKSPHRFLIYLKTPVRSDLPPVRTGWTYRVLPFPKAWTQTRLPFDLFFHHPRPDIFLSLTHYGPRWSPIPFVVAVMDLGFLKFPDQFTSRVFSQLKNWTGYSIAKSVHIFAISQATKTDIISAYGKSPESITVTYLAHDPKQFVPTVDPRVLEKYGISRPYFLFLSSLKPSKNVPGLIRGFSKFLHLPGSSGHLLVIAGKKAWMYDEIEKLVKHLHLENKIVFTGFIDDADVPALMTQSAAFVMPSFYEGFGIPVLEAMACETPVITSRVGSLPEVAGDAAIYVDPANPDSIAAGLSRIASGNRSKYVKLGLERVKLFSWEKCAQQTLSALENVVQRKY